jgi:hypothetical protein
MTENMNENTKENTFEPIGSWNEAGSIRSLDRKGFTPTKCGSEVIANSWDAGSRKATFRISGREDGTRGKGREANIFSTRVRVSIFL